MKGPGDGQTWILIGKIGVVRSDASGEVKASDFDAKWVTPGDDDVPMLHAYVEFKLLRPGH